MPAPKESPKVTEEAVLVGDLIAEIEEFLPAVNTSRRLALDVKEFLKRLLSELDEELQIEREEAVDLKRDEKLQVEREEAVDLIREILDRYPDAALRTVLEQAVSIMRLYRELDTQDIMCRLPTNRS